MEQVKKGAASASRTRSIAFVGLAVAIMAVSAWVTVPLGPVPFTLQMFAITFAIVMLSPKECIAAIVLYLALGAIGLPVFSGFKSGPQVLLGATGGYLVAYPLMALVLSLVCQHFKGFLPRLAGVILAVAVCYTFGTAWFMFMSGNDLATSLAWCVTPFVIPDLIKGVCALLLAKALESRLNKAAA